MKISEYTCNDIWEVTSVINNFIINMGGRDIKNINTTQYETEEHEIKYKVIILSQ